VLDGLAMKSVPKKRIDLIFDLIITHLID
jgi:hypothetical protein